MRIKLYRQSREFSPVAMADIAFLLLIFLILTTSINNKESVKLPVFEYSHKISYPKRVTIVISKAGTISIDGNFLSEDKLFSYLDSLSDKKSIIVRLMADRNTDYSNVDKILCLLRKENILKIVLVTKEPVDEKRE